MLAMTLALWHGPIGEWGIVDFLVTAILVVAAVAITIVALKYFEMWPPPEWLTKILMIVIVAVVAILAIVFIAHIARTL
jgi:hypothetical protein